MILTVWESDNVFAVHVSNRMPDTVMSTCPSIPAITEWFWTSPDINAFTVAHLMANVLNLNWWMLVPGGCTVVILHPLTTDNHAGDWCYCRDCCLMQDWATTTVHRQPRSRWRFSVRIQQKPLAATSWMMGGRTARTTQTKVSWCVIDSSRPDCSDNLDEGKSKRHRDGSRGNLDEARCLFRNRKGYYGKPTVSKRSVS